MRCGRQDVEGLLVEHGEGDCQSRRAKLNSKSSPPEVQPAISYTAAQQLAGCTSERSKSRRVGKEEGENCEEEVTAGNRAERADKRRARRNGVCELEGRSSLRLAMKRVPTM